MAPFIRAGFTQFAYSYCPKVLEILSNKLASGANAQMVTELINSKHYLDAAQVMEGLRTPANLARDLAAIFSADKLNQK